MVAAIAAAAWGPCSARCPSPPWSAILHRGGRAVVQGYLPTTSFLYTGRPALTALHRPGPGPAVRAGPAAARRRQGSSGRRSTPRRPADRQVRTPQLDRIIRVRLVRPLGRVHRLDADLDAHHLGERLQRGLWRSRPSSSRSPSSRGWPASSRWPRPPWPASARSPPPSWPTISASTCCSGGWSALARPPRVAVVLALLSLRLKGLGLALMTLAAALFFDNSHLLSDLGEQRPGRGRPCSPSWFGPFNFSPQRPRVLHPRHGRARGVHYRRPAGPQGHHRPVPRGHAGQRDGRQPGSAST